MKKTSEVKSAHLSKERIKLIEEIARKEKVNKLTILDLALEHYTKEYAAFAAETTSPHLKREPKPDIF